MIAMATHLTDLLVSTAEVSNLASILAVLGGLLVMMTFIIKLIYQDMDGGGVTKVTHRAPQTRMARVSVPILLGLGEGGTRGEDQVKLKLSSQVPYTIRYFWGVQVAAFHHVLRAPWPWFREAFLHGNLFGEGCLDPGKPSPTLQPHEELQLTARREGGERLELGPAPRNSYPLVVVAVPRAGLEGQVEDRAAVSAVLAVIHIRDSQCAIPTQVLGSYLRQGSAVTHLLPLYVTSSPGESSDTESAEDDEPEDSQLPLGPRARCVVCQLERVTRAALPCRHAITCATCFERLKSQCPMCRAFINSYFLLCPETSPRVDTPPASVQSLSLWQRSRQTWMRLNEWFNRGLDEN